MEKKRYQPINLPLDLVEELKLWRRAYMVASGRTVSYRETIRSMLDNLDDTEPDVTKAMGMLIENHPELDKKVGKYPYRFSMLSFSFQVLLRKDDAPLMVTGQIHNGY